MDFYLKRQTIEELQAMEPEDALEEIAKLRREHAEKRNAQNRARYHRNVEKARERKRKWYAALDPKRRKAMQKARWQVEKSDQDYMAKVRERNARRRRELGLDKHRVRDIEKVREKDRRAYQRKKTQQFAKMKPDDLTVLIKRHLPGYLLAPARADIINSFMELALARKVQFNKLPETVKQCVAAYNRQFDYFKTVSIDAPIAGTEGLTRADLLDSEVMHF